MNEVENQTAAPLLPEVYHCAVTWGIPFDFGGMTSAMFRRSRAFVTEGGVNVDILTFEYQNDYDDIVCELEAAGIAIPGLRVRNMWDELRAMTDEMLATAQGGTNVKGGFQPIADSEEHRDETFGGSLRQRIRYDASGATVLQVDYYRADGTIYVSDRRDLTTRGEDGGRLIVLCDGTGTPVASWNQMWPLYLFWLDCVVAGRETVMVIDSKSTANFITRFRRDHVVTMHLVHNSHMAVGQEPPFGELSSVRRYVFERLQAFDSVVLLTQRQKEDVDTAFSPGNTCVVPNSTQLPATLGEGLDRDPKKGVMLSSLTRRKRVHDAINAFDIVCRGHDGYTLTVYGSGPEQEKLSELVRAKGLDQSVFLAGYQSNAKAQLASASFVLLTSTMEGLPLVLLEAMSVGCIPIAYDIPYGPSDLIADGINGFIVKSGDRAALADRIVKLGELGDSEILAMRRSAQQTAVKFSDEAVTRIWNTEMRTAIDRKLDWIMAKRKAAVTVEA